MFMNDKVVKGDLFGGDIEPGQFCVQNISINRTEPAPAEEVVRDDLETAAAGQPEITGSEDGTF
jgi:hypothetical protein